MSGAVSLRAHAKVNLGLDVLRRREDGYHELRMIMQTVGLSDEVVLRRRTDGQIHLSCSVKDLPADASNLAWKACERIREACGIRDGVDITLEKSIPAAAGLAGGSADAAAVLHGMNELFDLGLSLEELQRIGVKIGADVPYCLLGGTALAEGIGEILTPLPAAPDCAVLIVKPAIDVSTAWVYKNLHLTADTQHPPIDEMLQAIREGDGSRLSALMGNVLEDVTIPAHPVIGEMIAAMKEGGAMGARMSGSGPSAFGLFAEEDRARACLENMKKRWPDAFGTVTEFTKQEPGTV